MKGLEPPLLSEPDPKSGAATNYATSAKLFQKLQTQRLARLPAGRQGYQLRHIRVFQLSRQRYAFFTCQKICKTAKYYFEVLGSDSD